MVGNYLKGEAPPPFDLLYWNGDSTNLPGPMFCWYLRHTYLQNELKQPGALTVCGETVDIGSIEAPFFVYGSREDHIVPWAAAYASTPLLKGKELATTFSFLRPNDLVWNYVVGNYLKGEAPPPFDLLYWNGDSTNLPGPMFCWYLRNTYLTNDLGRPGKLTVCGEIGRASCRERV